MKFVLALAKSYKDSKQFSNNTLMPQEKKIIAY